MTNNQSYFFTHGFKDKRILFHHFEYFQSYVSEKNINADFWMIPDAYHVDAMFKYPDEYGYKMKKNQNTLQSIRKHKFSNVLFKPGHSDITSLINFVLFHKILNKNNLDVKKIRTQNEFLKKIGILERANILSKKMTFKEKANMFYRLKRLLDYREMGSLFKVLFAKKKGKRFSLGF